MTEKEARERVEKYIKSLNGNALDCVAIGTVLTFLEKKDKIIDEIQEEVLDHIGFENRLKRDNREPDLFNQGRFYVANNINNILKGKLNE